MCVKSLISLSRTSTWEGGVAGSHAAAACSSASTPARAARRPCALCIEATSYEPSVPRSWLIQL